MEPPSHPQPNLAQQGKGVSEAVAPKGNPTKFYSQISRIKS